MTGIKAERIAGALAFEYLEEPDQRTAEALGRRLARLARGRAVVIGDRVLIPHPSGRLAIYPAWDVTALEDLSELAALASGARPVVVPYDSPRRRSFVGRVIDATGCTEEEADQVVADMEHVGFKGAEEFAEMAHALLVRNRAMEAAPSPLASTPDEA